MRFFAILLLLSLQSRLYSQCANDTVPPVAVCVDQITVVIGVDDPNDCYGPAGPNNAPPVVSAAGVSWVSASAFNSGSYDDCNNIHITVRRAGFVPDCLNDLNVYNGNAPCDDLFPDFPSEFERAISESDSVKFYSCDVGFARVVAMRVYQTDAAGNIMTNNGNPIFTECMVDVEVVDKTKPAIICPPNVTVSCQNFDPSLLAYGVAAATDNACLDTVINELNYTLFDTICNRGTIVRTFQAFDCSGNSVQCTHRIVVNYDQDYYIRFPNDLILTSPGGNSFGQPEFFGEDCELLTSTYEDKLLNGAPDADLRIERTWKIINWCAYDPGQPVVEVPNPNPDPAGNSPANLPGPTVSAAGAPVPWNPTVVKITPADTATNYSVFYNPGANGYTYTQIIKIIDPVQAIVSGKVFLDTLNDCSFNAGEPLLANWKVKATGLVSGESNEVFADSTGGYFLLLPQEDTLAEITLAVPFNFGQNCPSVYTIQTAGGQTTVQDIPAHLETTCPRLSVDLSTPFLRRCFPNTYAVQACNLGTETVENVHVEVALDPFMTFLNSSIPGVAIGNNTYSFELGDMGPGDCSTYSIFFTLECAAPLGYTHCSTAHIYPDSLCPVSANWSGADLKVSGVCDGDSVRLTLSNIGNGDMTQMQDFVVVEDVVMYMSSTFQLDHGISETLAVPANGATWRIETQEVPNHPFGGIVAAVVEGCGGLNTPGLVNIFPPNSDNPFESADCQENIGSFDPNDKQGFPKGYGDQHLVKANTDIEYLIRFQNTGTDTAFSIVVLDTLSEYLDAASVRAGTASHPYNFAVLDGKVLRFQFDNVMLPDSNKNENASHGFVKFTVLQKPDNPDGTRIENRAAIFFDFNDPVLTNTTFHTIGDHFILVSTDEGPDNAAAIHVYPNPASGEALFEMPLRALSGTFVLSNNIGQRVRSEQFSGGRYRFSRGILPAGMYFYEISNVDGQRFTGKIILK